MGFVIIGLNHRTAPLNYRERFAISDDLACELIKRLSSQFLINGIVIVNTCNRVELYIETSSIKTIVLVLAKYLNFEIKEIKKYVYLKYGKVSTEHLFLVASGLDSMVIGENEILGQLKSSFNRSLMLNATGKYLHRLFEACFKVAKNVRTHTEIAQKPLSIASLAVKYALQVFYTLADKSILIIGTGQTAKLVLQHLLANGANKFILAARSLYNAELLVNELNIRSITTIITINEIPNYLPLVDIISSQTSSELPIISKTMLAKCLKVRSNKPMVILDLAVPRDIEATVKSLNSIFLCCIDDLQSMAAQNTFARKIAVSNANSIIQQEVTNFLVDQRVRDVAPMIVKLQDKMQIHKERSILDAKKMLQQGADPDLVLNQFARDLINKILHDPIVSLKKSALNGEIEYIEFIQEVFNLN